MNATLESAIGSMKNLPKAKPRKEYGPVAGILTENGIDYEIFDMMSRVKRFKIKPFAWWDHKGNHPEGFELSVACVPEATVYLKFLDGPVGMIRFEDTAKMSEFIIRIPLVSLEGPR